MAGKNGKNGGTSGVDEEEVKATEAPKAEVTKAAEPPKPDATPEDESTYVSQMMFGQKTYDQQMKDEKHFAGLNRTDEISQLGGASKLEVDLAQMKIFSTERIGDDLYAAIQRGDTHKVEAMTGMNSDRRLTEAQILVLLKAKREHDDDVAKKIALDAYYAQELEGKKKHADDEFEFYDKRADDQNQRTTSPDVYSSNLAPGWHEDGSYTNPYGGTTDINSNYHAPDGSTVWNNGLWTNEEGDAVTTNGVEFDASERVINIPSDTGGPATRVELDPDLTQEQAVAVGHDATNAAQNVLTGGEILTNTAEQQAAIHGDSPAPAASMDSSGRASGPSAVAMAAASAATTADNQSIAAQRRGEAGARPTRFTLSEAALKEFTESRTGLTTQIMKSDPDAEAFLRAKGRHVGHMSQQDRINAAKQFTAEDFIDFKRKIGKGDEADDLQRRVDEIRVRAESQRKPNPAHPETQSLVDRPSTAPVATATTAATAAIASQLNTTNLTTLESAGATTTANNATVTNGFDSEDGGYYDSSGGYFDEFGGYYDDQGGYDDGMGGYYAADGGYFDPNGGYQWPDGSFEDKFGNYVDKDGNLVAKDGSYFPADPDNKDKYTFMLRENARQPNAENPFEPDPSKQVPGATDAFMKLPGSWKEKREMEKAADQAALLSTPVTQPADADAPVTVTSTRSGSGESSWFMAKNYFDTASYTSTNFSLPIYDPLKLPGTTNPLSPTAPQFALA